MIDSSGDSAVRLNKWLAQCGLGSRRSCEDLIRLDRVRCNGVLVRDLGHKVFPGDLIEVDGKAVRPQTECRVWMLHKPAGYLCSRGDTHGRMTVYDLLPQDLQGLHYVGRLDYDTRGLLFLTQDGDLSQGLTRPEQAVPRIYRVWIDRRLTEFDAKRLESGLLLADGTMCRPAQVLGLGRSFDMVLREGKKREIREMMRTLGHRVQDLMRIEYGEIVLDVPEGQIRELSDEEVEHLRSWVGAPRRGGLGSGLSSS
jgi:23S rRNA pseudouridine2605 synthase